MGLQTDSYTVTQLHVGSKLAFPFDWMTSLEKLEETEFPPIEAFYSELKQSGIDSDTYKKMSDIFKVTLEFVL